MLQVLFPILSFSKIQFFFQFFLCVLMYFKVGSKGFPNRVTFFLQQKHWRKFGITQFERRFFKRIFLHSLKNRFWRSNKLAEYLHSISNFKWAKVEQLLALKILNTNYKNPKKHFKYFWSIYFWVLSSLIGNHHSIISITLFSFVFNILFLHFDV